MVPGIVSRCISFEQRNFCVMRCLFEQSYRRTTRRHLTISQRTLSSDEEPRTPTPNEIFREDGLRYLRTQDQGFLAAHETFLTELQKKQSNICEEAKAYAEPIPVASDFNPELRYRLAEEATGPIYELQKRTPKLYDEANNLKEHLADLRYKPYEDKADTVKQFERDVSQMSDEEMKAELDSVMNALFAAEKSLDELVLRTMEDLKPFLRAREQSSKKVGMTQDKISANTSSLIRRHDMSGESDFDDNPDVGVWDSSKFQEEDPISRVKVSEGEKRRLHQQRKRLRRRLRRVKEQGALHDAGKERIPSTVVEASQIEHNDQHDVIEHSGDERQASPRVTKSADVTTIVTSTESTMTVTRKPGKNRLSKDRPDRIKKRKARVALAHQTPLAFVKRLQSGQDQRKEDIKNVAGDPEAPKRVQKWARVSTRSASEVRSAMPQFEAPARTSSRSRQSARSVYNVDKRKQDTTGKVDAAKDSEPVDKPREASPVEPPREPSKEPPKAPVWEF